MDTGCLAAVITACGAAVAAVLVGVASIIHALRDQVVQRDVHVRLERLEGRRGGPNSEV